MPSFDQLESVPFESRYDGFEQVGFQVESDRIGKPPNPLQRFAASSTAAFQVVLDSVVQTGAQRIGEQVVIAYRTAAANEQIGARA